MINFNSICGRSRDLETIEILEVVIRKYMAGKYSNLNPEILEEQLKHSWSLDDYKL